MNEAKRNGYPVIKIYDIGDEEAQAFVINKLGYISYIPVFAIVEEDVLAQFDGYTDYQSFYKDLDHAMEESGGMSKEACAPRDGLEPPTK